MEKFRCERCGNEDLRFTGIRNGKRYCRKCISFQGNLADTSFVCKEGLGLSLKYPLSDKQKEVSDKVVSILSQKRNVLIHAVTGAGKTELVYQAMENALKERGHVGFATPRKDVVIDLLPRIKEAFPQADFVSVYGGHTFSLEGDIILLTTHQLYRYRQYFDLLILDEIDAFPYKDNDVLNHFFYDAVRGNYVLLSATPSKSDIDHIEKDNGEVVSLFERYHKGKLPEPVFIQHSSVLQRVAVLRLLKKYQEERKPVFVFSPEIEEGRKLFFFLRRFYPNGAFVSSKEDSRRLDIEKFKTHELDYLVTTSILERGVTVKNLQVIVYMADNVIYDSATLIQIAGRVGRKMDARDGDVIFLGRESSPEIEEAIYEIKRYNRKAHLL